MNNPEINELCIQLQSLSGYAASQQLIPFNAVLAVREKIVNVAQQISSINAPISNHLIDLKNNLFIEIPYQCFCINQIAYGQTIECLEVVKGQIFATNQTGDRGLCHLLHPDILRVSEKLYRDGSYSEVACRAFIEINSRLKSLYRAKYPDSENVPDGQPLMNKVFAENDPILEAGDRTTQTGKDIHSGTRFLFAGAMAALRNPKAHENIEIGKDDSMRQLIFASMLMFQIDEIIASSDNNS